jgi:hypothetical protein
VEILVRVDRLEGSSEGALMTVSQSIEKLENGTRSTASTARSRVRSVVLAALAVVALASATGCVKVAPYERGTLAHPTMTTDDMALGVDAHVRGVSEGASGGLGGGGGGCGCN